MRCWLLTQHTLDIENMDPSPALLQGLNSTKLQRRNSSQLQSLWLLSNSTKLQRRNSSQLQSFWLLSRSQPP